MWLYELAKMDGAVVISPDMSRVHYANAQLSLDPDEHTAPLRDYIAPGTDYEEAKTRLKPLKTDRLTDPVVLARILGYKREKLSENVHMSPRGSRQLDRVPRLPKRVAERLVNEFGSLKRLADVSKKDLGGVRGVDRALAHAVRRHLRRPEESGTLDELAR